MVLRDCVWYMAWGSLMILKGPYGARDQILVSLHVLSPLRHLPRQQASRAAD